MKYFNQFYVLNIISCLMGLYCILKGKQDLAFLTLPFVIIFYLLGNQYYAIEQQRIIYQKVKP